MNPFLRVIDALNRQNVRYVIVGGFAGYLHGTRRITVDLDIIIDLKQPAALQAMEALLAAGFQSRLPVDARQFANPTIRRSWIDEKRMVVFSMFHPEEPGFIVDIFVDEPIEFDALFSRSSEENVEGRFARICSIEDLIDLKLRANRPKDQVDIDTLRQIQSIRRSKQDNQE